jgi:glycosyltransferase involved in cell wall biosynthesis
VRQIANITLYESTFKLEWMEAPWDDIEAAGDWLLELEARTRPDVVHLNGYVHGALPWQSPTLVVGHSCVFSWFAAVQGTAPPTVWDRYRQEVGRGLRAADRVTAPTAAMLTALHTHYGTFTAAPAIANGRRASCFPPGAKEPCILTAGRVWDAAKNVALLEEVAPSLSWPVFVAGEAHHPEGGVVACKAVQGLGQLTPAELATWLGCAAIFALPARYEPFGLSALEAGLAGCTLVLGDIPSLREVWGEAALFVPPDRPDVLAETLESLIKDARWRALMAQRARACALCYTPERMARAYVALYTHLLRRARCPLLPPLRGRRAALLPSPAGRGRGDCLFSRPTGRG